MTQVTVQCSILKVKIAFKSMTYRESQELVKAIDQFTIGKDIEDFMKQEMARRFPEDFLSIDQYDSLSYGGNNKMEDVNKFESWIIPLNA